jgi:hypothetical protein
MRLTGGRHISCPHSPTMLSAQHGSGAVLLLLVAAGGALTVAAIAAEDAGAACVTVSQFAEHAEALRRERDAATARADGLEVRLATLEAMLDWGSDAAGGSGANARRRAQRTGSGAEAAQIIKIETQVTDCPPTSGRFGLTECEDPAFERCHRAACSPILRQGHRRMQAVGPQACPAAGLPARTAAVNDACCPDDACTGGAPDTCSAACAAVFLPWWDDCEVALGKDGRQFEPTVELCEATSGTGVSIAQQLGVQCTDGTDTADCVPECSEPLHGFLMLLNIGGEDSKLSCELHHGFYSWVGAAVRIICTRSLSRPRDVFFLSGTTSLTSGCVLYNRRMTAAIWATTFSYCSLPWCLVQQAYTSGRSCRMVRSERT